MTSPEADATPPGWPPWVWFLALATGLAIAYVGRSLLVPTLVGLAGAYLINPLVRRLQERGIARANAVALVIAAITALLAGTLSLSMSTLQIEGRKIIEEAPAFATEIETALDNASREARTSWPLLGRFLPGHVEPGWLSRAVQTGVGDGLFTEHLGSMLTLLILSPVFAFFFLRDGPPMVDWIIGRIHPRHIETSVAAWAQLDLIIGRYLRGLALESAGVGVLSGVGLWILGVPFPLLIGLFAAIVNPVPYVGVLVSLAVAFLVALTAQMGVGSLGGVAVLFLVIRLIDDVVLVPLTIGRSVHLHPLLVIVSIVIGEHALGVLGMVLAVPAVTVVKEVAWLLLEHRRTLSRATSRWIAADEMRHLPL